MYSIKDNITVEYDIKHSTFIAKLFPVDDAQRAKTLIDEIKAEYSGANHHCSAYIIGEHQEIQKADDDGEPSQTAGIPILDVLKKNDMTNVLCVVIRYFGGIKLGAGGLIRAYSKGASDALKEATLTQKVFYDYLDISVPFDQIGPLEHIIGEEARLLERLYTDKVTFKVIIPSQSKESFNNRIIEATQNKAKIIHVKTEEKYQ